MAHPLFWPAKYFFYPIGNTSAVCLTRDLAPEEPPKILLLGCGDPRNVLYTIFCEPQNSGRTLDFTCCDFDPAVLARNVLLFTMVADKLPEKAIWNMFFHMYLNNDSRSILIEQCRKLIGLSDNLQRWNASTYGPFMKMCTEYTLAELRRHWSLYVNMQSLPRKRLKAISDAFTEQSKSSSRSSWLYVTAARSAGPLFARALPVITEHFEPYWRTGVTTSDDHKEPAAKLLNPTFVYSLGGEGFSVHYGLDPLSPFHLAALFGNSIATVSASDAVKAAKAEFSSWCSAFHTSISSVVSGIPVIRFILGEAMAVCRALQAFAATETLELGVPVAQWKTQLIKLNKDEYVSGGAPAIFNVIDTSNLVDHIGLLNVLIAAVPLLSTPPRSSVLYTESLLFTGQDATKAFTERMYTDFTAISLLLGVCPVDYLSGFTTRSNTHELIMYQIAEGGKKQFHQVTTWKSPASGDVIAVHSGGEYRPPAFTSSQLGTLLYDMYHKLFKEEDLMKFLMLDKDNMQNAVATSNLIHFTRESFVLFLKLVRDRLCISEMQWLEVINRFFDILHADQSLQSMDSVNLHDLWVHLHRHRVYTASVYHVKLPKIGRFSDWDTVPALVRIILTVPREKLAVLENAGGQFGTPLLHCDVRGRHTHNIFASVHVAFGRVIPIGTNTHPKVVFEEDPEGWAGSSSLVVSFVMSTVLLTDMEPMDILNVCFSVRRTLATVPLVEKLGMQLNIFTAKLMDKSQVHVLPEQPLPSRKLHASSRSDPPGTPRLLAQIGGVGAVLVDLDEQCELVTSLTCRVSVEDEEVKRLFGSGAMPQTAHVSPCVMRITIGTHMQDVLYPFPIIGSRYKLRLARKSLYIEVVVPVSGTFNPEGMKLNPFAVVGSNSVRSPWSIHRVNLSRLPILDIKATKVGEWLNHHVSSMMSNRERSLRKHKNDVLVMVKDTLHSIFVRSSGIQGGSMQRLFALRDEATQNCDTIFFISDLRFDLHSHTMVCDGYVLPLTDWLMPKIETPLAKLLGEGNIEIVTVFEGEMKAWKQLLPAFVERCRSAWKHGENCEYEVQGKIPLTEEMELDPLCSCGRGKDVEGMHKVGLWRKLAPYVTRIALSPLFAVSYLETVIPDPAAHKCFVCEDIGTLLRCTVCKKVWYCSPACQKKDWKIHKTQCKAWTP